MCGTHAHRRDRYGDPLWGGVIRKRTPVGAPRAWFAALISDYLNGDLGDGCVTAWPYNRNKKGYPGIWWNGKDERAHHLVLLLTGHPRPAGYQARHLCGNGHLGCLHPDHLKWGTAAENAADRDAHGTTARGRRYPVAKLSEDAVREIRTSRETNKALSERFGVADSGISRIRSRQLWAWVTDAPLGV